LVQSKTQFDPRSLRRVSQNPQRQLDTPIGPIEHEALNRVAAATDDVMPGGGAQAPRGHAANAAEADDGNG
jgi:hypothetical protein